MLQASKTAVGQNQSEATEGQSARTFTGRTCLALPCSWTSATRLRGGGDDDDGPPALCYHEENGDDGSSSALSAAGRGYSSGSELLPRRNSSSVRVVFRRTTAGSLCDAGKKES